MQTKNLKTPFFECIYKSTRSDARVGKIHTAHGVIDTPGFVAVGTNGTIKSLDNHLVSSIGLQLMFCNTYHLLLQPGVQTIREAGGIHKFINRSLPIITDSGGFQVFSLNYGSIASELKRIKSKWDSGHVIKISEEGVLFRSYRDGEKVLLTPESSVSAQKDFGSDIIIPLDELPPYHIQKTKLEDSLERTHRWEKRSLDLHLQNPKNQAMYGVIHGGIDSTLRARSCEFLTSLPFNGFAIGGSLGKSKVEMMNLLEHTLPRLPKDKPNHLLGIGDLASLQLAIPLGVDTFDSSYPTKLARHGIALTKEGQLNVTKSNFSQSFTPIEDGCSCHTCRHYTAAYVHHLFKAKELTALQLTSVHNLFFMMEYMRIYRNKILRDEI